MKTVPNQRVITILKTETTRDKHFAAVDMEALFGAMYDLKSLCGFKLYMYLAKNKGNYSLALSSQDFMNCANCSKTAYNTAFNELVEKGYLVPKADSKTRFLFVDKVLNETRATTATDNYEETEDFAATGKTLFTFEEMEKGSQFGGFRF